MVFWTSACGAFYHTINIGQTPIPRNGETYLPSGSSIRIVRDLGRKTGYFEILTTNRKTIFYFMRRLTMEKVWNGYRLKLFHIHGLYVYEAEILDENGRVLKKILITKDGGNPIFIRKLETQINARMF